MDCMQIQSVLFTVNSLQLIQGARCPELQEIESSTCLLYCRSDNPLLEVGPKQQNNHTIETRRRKGGRNRGRLPVYWWVCWKNIALLIHSVFQMQIRAHWKENRSEIWSLCEYSHSRIIQCAGRDSYPTIHLWPGQRSFPDINSLSISPLYLTLGKNRRTFSSTN